MAIEHHPVDSGDPFSNVWGQTNDMAWATEDQEAAFRNTYLRPNKLIRKLHARRGFFVRFKASRAARRHRAALEMYAAAGVAMRHDN